tara:strand:- start:1002 stop:1553 length:552 start_codon:yes stop_codon:yes gene_type:complete
MENLKEIKLMMERLESPRLTQTELNHKKNLLKEDILELKQMSKQIYSFLKKKGYGVKMKTEQGDKGRESFNTNLDLDDTVQLVIQEGSELVMIALPVRAVVKKLTGDKDLNSSKETEKYGNDSQDWYVNKEVTNYVDKLGDEIINQLTSKYPNMKHSFDKDNQTIFYFMKFGYGRNKKGGDIK